MLVCPGCQAAHDWTADLDTCSRCGSTRLVRRLGEVECRECGFVLRPEVGPGPPPDGEQAPGLSEDVGRALDRVLRRSGHGVRTVN